MTEKKSNPGDPVTQRECAQKSLKFALGIVASVIGIISLSATFLFFSLTRSSTAVDKASTAIDTAHNAEKAAVKAVAELKTNHDKTFHEIASKLKAHESAQVETGRRVDESLNRIEGALKEQTSEMKEQRGMILTIMRNGNH